MKADLKKARETAEKLIEENYIASPPIDILDLCNSFGIQVVAAVFEDKKISAFIDYDEMKITVSKTDSYERQRFSIAHELGHYILHKPKEINTPEDYYRVDYRKTLMESDKEPNEKEANAFAAYLLVPSKFLRPVRHVHPQDLAKAFCVSPSMMGYRLRYE